MIGISSPAFEEMLLKVPIEEPYTNEEPYRKFQDVNKR